MNNQRQVVSFETVEITVLLFLKPLYGSKWDIDDLHRKFKSLFLTHPMIVQARIGWKDDSGSVFVYRGRNKNPICSTDYMPQHEHFVDLVGSFDYFKNNEWGVDIKTQDKCFEVTHENPTLIISFQNK